MADDDSNVVVNGVAAEKRGEETASAAESFYDVAVERESNEAKLKQRIEALEKEKLSLVKENGEVKDQVTKLTGEIESLRSEVSGMEREIEQSEESKRVLESVASRAAELETEVSRLQHDLISAMTEGEESSKEVAELTKAVGEKEVRIEEMKKEKAEAERNVRELERKVGVLEVRESEERSERVRFEEEMRERVREAESELSDCKKRMVELAKETEELREAEEKATVMGGKKSDLEGLREAEEKARVMERKVSELEKEVKERCLETINGIKVNSRERGMKVQWPVVALGSTGAIVAGAAVVYLCYARRR